VAERPNVLLIVSDEERRNDWLDGTVDLPAHERLRADGLSFDRYFTHSSPCSPSRASLYTGRYLAEHGVVDNVTFPTHTALDPAIPTIGNLLTEQGYRSSYLGKWHLGHTESPDMAAHGYLDWEGNDVHFMGSAYTGRYFDPIIVDQAIDWLSTRARDGSRPWFLTVALVNPHDIMWFPADHLSYQAEHAKFAEFFNAVVKMRLGDLPVTPPPEDYPRLFDRLPDNFGDDLHTKPEVQRAWRHVRNTEHMVGRIDAADHDTWLRGLDYYAWLHVELDASLTRLLAALDDLGLYDDTVIAYTSDHGDACGSHGLRAKLPCVYDEVMGVPLIVKAPGVPAGAHTGALATHVDLAATIAALGGIDMAATPTLSGRDLSPVLADPEASVRDFVLFSQDSAQSDLIRNTRYAVRGFFDGETKYARYYGIGGGIQRDGTAEQGGKLFDVDADFDDHDHEWYLTAEDPHELVNLAHDRGRRNELRDLFRRLLDYESQELTQAP
jgi:arylsulfatase